MLSDRYPIGEFHRPEVVGPEGQVRAISEIAGLPGEVRAAVSRLSPEQLDTRYRPEGWTIRQVVHHLPDSHLNGYTRFKLALTEDEPTIRTYEEALWAELPDSAADVEFSLSLLEALHARWVCLLEALESDSWLRQLNHPEVGKMRLEELVVLYAWHGRHHLAHITTTRDREGW